MANPYTPGTGQHTIWNNAYKEGFSAGQSDGLSGDYLDGFNAGLDEGGAAALETLDERQKNRLMAPEVAMKMIALSFKILAFEQYKQDAFNSAYSEAAEIQRELRRTLAPGNGATTLAYRLASKMGDLTQLSSYYLYDPGHEFHNKLTTKREREILMTKFVHSVNYARSGEYGSKARAEGARECANLVLAKINDKTLEL